MRVPSTVEEERVGRLCFFGAKSFSRHLGKWHQLAAVRLHRVARVASATRAARVSADAGCRPLCQHPCPHQQLRPGHAYASGRCTPRLWAGRRVLRRQQRMHRRAGSHRTCCSVGRCGGAGPQRPLATAHVLQAFRAAGLPELAKRFVFWHDRETPSHTLASVASNQSTPMYYRCTASEPPVQRQYSTNVVPVQYQHRSCMVTVQ